MSKFLSVRNAGRLKLRPRNTSSSVNISSSSINNTLFSANHASYTTAAKSSIVQRSNNVIHGVRRFTNTNVKLDGRERNLSAAQLQLQLNHLSKAAADSSGGNANSSMPTLSELTAWVLHKVKVPRGAF